MEEAIELFEYVRDQRPDYTHSWSRLAVAELQAGRIQDAIVHFERAASLDPTNRTASDMLIRLAQER